MCSMTLPRPYTPARPLAYFFPPPKGACVAERSGDAFARAMPVQPCLRLLAMAWRAHAWHCQRQQARFGNVSAVPTGFGVVGVLVSAAVSAAVFLWVVSVLWCVESEKVVLNEA